MMKEGKLTSFIDTVYAFTQEDVDSAYAKLRSRRYIIFAMYI